MENQNFDENFEILHVEGQDLNILKSIEVIKIKNSLLLLITKLT